MIAYYGICMGFGCVRVVVRSMCVHASFCSSGGGAFRMVCPWCGYAWLLCCVALCAPLALHTYIHMYPAYRHILMYSWHVLTRLAEFSKILPYDNNNKNAFFYSWFILVHTIT